MEIWKGQNIGVNINERKKRESAQAQMYDKTTVTLARHEIKFIPRQYILGKPWRLMMASA